MKGQAGSLSYGMRSILQFTCPSKRLAFSDSQHPADFIRFET